MGNPTGRPIPPFIKVRDLGQQIEDMGAAEAMKREANDQLLEKVLDILHRSLPPAAAKELYRAVTDWRISKCEADALLMGEPSSKRAR